MACHKVLLVCSIADTAVLTAASVAYMVVSTGLILINKRIMHDDGFHYPMALSSLGMSFSAIVSFVLCQVILGTTCIPPSVMKFDRKRRCTQPLRASSACIQVLGLTDRKSNISLRFYLVQILPVGLPMALSLQFGNTAYLYLSVSFVEMLKVRSCKRCILAHMHGDGSACALWSCSS